MDRGVPRSEYEGVLANRSTTKQAMLGDGEASKATTCVTPLNRLDRKPYWAVGNGANAMVSSSEDESRAAWDSSG